MTIMDESGIEIFVLPDCARCELAGCNPCDLNDCPRGLSECVPSSCLYYTEEWNNDDYEPDPDREYEEARDNGIWLST